MRVSVVENVQVDDHCKLTSGDEIAAAVNQILGSI